MAKTTFDSWEQLQAQISTILEQVNGDPALAVAAAANPLHALEDLGYAINPHARAEIEDRIRFDHRRAVRLRQLREQIFDEVGHPFDINSPHELERVLTGKLGIDLSDQEKAEKRSSRRARVSLQPLPPQLGWGQKVQDPLEEFRGRHHLVELLIEYRRLEASEPRLASRELYESIKNGTRKSPLTRARGVLRKQSSKSQGA